MKKEGGKKKKEKKNPNIFQAGTGFLICSGTSLKLLMCLTTSLLSSGLSIFFGSDSLGNGIINNWV